MVGFLNVEIWIGVEGILVDDLRLDRKFPDSPVVGWLTTDAHTHTHTHTHTVYVVHIYNTVHMFDESLLCCSIRDRSQVHCVRTHTSAGTKLHKQL